jgi:hypothetical protein
MKLSTNQIQDIAQRVLSLWKAQQLITMNVPEKDILTAIENVVRENIQQEEKLDRDVHKMLDDLERSNPGGFQRHKMFTMLKQKLAQERKFVL